MKITKHPVGKDGTILIQNGIRLLTMGLQDNTPTIWAVTDPLRKQGITMKFHVLKDGDATTIQECQRYITSFISNKGAGVFHLFTDKPQIEVPPPMATPPPGGGPTRDPGGGQILT